MQASFPPEIIPNCTFRVNRTFPNKTSQTTSRNHEIPSLTGLYSSSPPPGTVFIPLQHRSFATSRVGYFCVSKFFLQCCLSPPHALTAPCSNACGKKFYEHLSSIALCKTVTEYTSMKLGSFWRESGGVKQPELEGYGAGRKEHTRNAVETVHLNVIKRERSVDMGCVQLAIS